MDGIFRNKFAGNLVSRILNTPRYLQTLAYKELRSSTDRPYDSTAFILHGLMGSGKNWRSFSHDLLSRLSHSSSTAEWRVVLVDLRNHGRSANLDDLTFDEPHDMTNAAMDLAELVEAQGWAWPDVVMGHSMGAKVALQFTRSCDLGHYGHSASLPEQLWVIDSVPGYVKDENCNGENEKVLKFLRDAASSEPLKRGPFRHKLEFGFSRSVGEWIHKKLKKARNNETWNFNFEPAVHMFNSFKYLSRNRSQAVNFLLVRLVLTMYSATARFVSLNFDDRDTSYWPLLMDPPKDMEIEIVLAKKSNHWSRDVLEQLESLSSKGSEDQPRGGGQVCVHILPNSGHWVYVDNPNGLLNIVAPKFASL